MKVLVTGATGFVGKSLMALLAARGHVAVAVTRTPQPGTLVWDFAAGGPPPEMPRDATAVIHLAQSRVYRNFPEDAPTMFAVNVAATHALLQAAAAAGIPRFCLVSSGSVYEPFGGSMREDAPLMPHSFLGASKLAGEVIARPYAALLSLLVLRLFFPYGPGQTGRLVPEIVRRVTNGVPIDVSPDGEGVHLSPTHVEDVCDAIVTGVEAQWTGTINVAAPQVLSVAEIGRQIGEALGKPVAFNPCLPAAARIVPDLTRFAGLYDLARMRTFRTSVPELVEHGAA